MPFDGSLPGSPLARRLEADRRRPCCRVDSYDPAALATIRRSARTRIASCESLYGRRQFRPYLEQQAVDVAIIDVAWNGILESAKIAAMADAYEVNVAPHNFNGHLGSLMSAHLCAAIQNFRVMEIDIEDVFWKDDLVSQPPVIAAGDALSPCPGGCRFHGRNSGFHRPRRAGLKRGRDVGEDGA
jgi:galactonate dehydratase